MKSKVGFLCALALAATTSSSAVLSQTAAPFSPPSARIVRASAGQPLTPPSSASSTAVVGQFLRANGFSDATVRSLELVSEGRVARTGMTHARFVQRVEGLLVHGVYAKAALSGRGELTSLIENLVAVRATNAVAGRVPEQDALGNALRNLYGDAATPPGIIRQEGNSVFFERTPFFHAEPRVTRVAVELGGGPLHIGYLVETWSEARNLLHHTLVRGDGAVLDVELRTSSDSYNVFAVHPAVSPQTVVGGPVSSPGSPTGWLFGGPQSSVNIAGNNVNAYLDADANNAADAGGSTVNDGNFTTAANLGAEPSTPGNRNVAVQNLFYLNNLLHDLLYGYGFDEAAGNFQETNPSATGSESDSVNAEAQDGSGLDNANFATPTDGSNPRMQMFLWNGLGMADVVVGVNSYVAQAAGFGPSLTTTGVTGPLALVNDGAGTTSDACERFPHGALAGMVALVDRGTCNFDVKVKNVQRAGAIAAIVANNQGDTIFTMAGANGGVSISAVFVGQANGTTLKGLVGQAATVSLADPPPLHLDGDLDSDIVYHEYGHGLTWRMIGGMSGVVAGAIGEGMSDVLAIIFNNHDRVGEYSASSAAGIRSAPYTNYPRSYADFGGTGIHFDGEIYAAIGWRLWEKFQTLGLSLNDARDLLLGYLVDGMNHTPMTPTFEQMRDGILAAVTDADHECMVWQAFADYGVGQGSSAVVRGKRVVVTESNAIPAEVCTP